MREQFKLFSAAKKVVIVLAMIVAVLAPTMQVEAATEVNITSCQINGENKSKVNITVDTSNISCDDNILYLFEAAPYETSISGKTPIAFISYGKAGAYDFEVDLNYNTVTSRLYKKFAIGVKRNGSFEMVSDFHYITNPEILASFNFEKPVARTKKGLAGSLYTLKETNCDNGLINITFEQILSSTPTGCSYTYDGFTVYFKEQEIRNLDYLISGMSKNDIVVSLGLASAENRNIPELIYPGAENQSGVVQYGFNTANETGVKYVAAITAFLAERYSDPNSDNGFVSNWFIGNEVNDEKVYYSIGANGVDDFTEKYMQTFRIMYNIIRSNYSNADVYMRLANLWYVEQETDNYAGKILLEKFNALGKKEGNFDWSLSYHPYSCPLDDADVLDDGEIVVQDIYGNNVGLAEQNENTFQVTMYNIEVLTNFLQKAELRAPDGGVRSITLSEQGYTSNSAIGGKEEVIQAASIAYAYYKTECNPYIESFLYYRYQDDQNILNGQPNWCYGLLDVAGNKKYAYNVFKDMNTSNSLMVTDFAKALYGKSSWSELISGFDKNKVNSLPTYTKGNLMSAPQLIDGNVIASDMTNEWELVYNMMTLSQYNIGVDGNANMYEPRTWAVTSPEATVDEYGIIKKEFTTPLNLTDAPYLEFNFELDLDPYVAQNIKQASVLVKVYSGSDVYEASAIVDVGQTYYSKQYHMYLDLCGWSSRNTIDKIEVWVNQYNADTPIVAELMIYDLQYTAVCPGGNALTPAVSNKTDISNAVISGIGPQVSTGQLLKPVISVNLNGKSLSEGKDYVVGYYDNYTAGTAKVIVAGINNYTGYVGTVFTIMNAAPIYNGIDYSAVFDATYYYNTNPDVANALGSDSQTLLWHFVTFGMAEGRCAKADFNVVNYMYCLLNDDLRAAYGGDMKQYYYHYMNYGRYEGRSVSDYDSIFDPQYYLDNNPDVKKNIIERYTADGNLLGWALWHYYEYGMNEGRRGSAIFGVFNYEAANADIYNAYRNNYRQATIHYLQYGLGRPIIGNIDIYNMESIRPDVCAVFGSNPDAWIGWYIAYGASGC